MSFLKRNIIANFAGQGWSALMTLAFVPLYIKFLGIEAYGLIGFFAMLQGALQVLDLGLSQTMNREMARYSIQPEKAGEARNFVRTLEIGYWVIGIAIGVITVAFAPFIAEHWIKTNKIPVSTIQLTVAIMGVVVALQWPLSLYAGGLLGMQRQVSLNVIRISISTLSGGGAVLILWLVSPTITAFFTWQIVVSAVDVSMLTIFLWRSLPRAEGASRFDHQLLRNIWRFAAGMSGITLSAIVLMQMDKIILSKLLSLEMFGYYTLAGVVSNVVPAMVVGPIFNGLFPRFSSLVAISDEAALKLLYHQSAQLIAVLALSVAAVVAFFPYDILLLWTGDVKTAQVSAPIVRILVIGMALNALMAVPYALQLAYGWTSIGLRINTLFIITLVPILYFMTTHYGAIGGAAGWVILNSIYIVIGIPLTHRRLLIGEALPWLRSDVLPPLIATIVIVGGWRLLITGTRPIFESIIILFMVFCSTLLAAAFSAKRVRAWISIQIFRANLPWI